MKKREGFFRPAIGGTGLLVIFAVLCLVVFALLSVHTVLAEQRLSDAAARSVTAWYTADLQAQEIFARLRGGETVAGVEQVGEEYHYTLPISHHQTLVVVLNEHNGCWEVLSWQAVPHPPVGDTSLPIWQE